MIALFLFQATQEPAPQMTIQGAVLLLLLGLLPFATRIYEAIAKMLENNAARMNLKNENRVQEMDAFRILKEQVDYLREEVEQGRIALREAVKKADYADERADKFEAELKYLRLQFENLTRELDVAKGTINSKNEQISSLEKRLTEVSLALVNLTNENVQLRSKNVQLEQQIQQLQGR